MDSHSVVALSLLSEAELNAHLADVARSEGAEVAAAVDAEVQATKLTIGKYQTFLRLETRALDETLPEEDERERKTLGRVVRAHERANRLRSRRDIRRRLRLDSKRRGRSSRRSSGGRRLRRRGSTAKSHGPPGRPAGGDEPPLGGRP